MLSPMCVRVCQSLRARVDLRASSLTIEIITEQDHFAAAIATDDDRSSGQLNSGRLNVGALSVAHARLDVEVALR